MVYRWLSIFIYLFWLNLFDKIKIVDNTLLYNKLTILPESMKSEVSDFIDFLISKAKKITPIQTSLSQNLEAVKVCSL